MILHTFGVQIGAYEGKLGYLEYLGLVPADDMRLGSHKEQCLPNPKPPIYHSNIGYVGHRSYGVG